MDNLPANNKPVFLIDASIYIFQAHFSPYVECFDANGDDLSALYGFSQFLMQFIRREKPEVLAVAMDESLFCGFRHGLCNNYKSNRELPDENLARQLKACAILCHIFGLACFSSRQYEADDIIGTLAKRIRTGSGPDTTISIVSRDKDLSQLLLSGSMFVWDYQQNRKRFRHDIKEEFGVFPDQIPDYLGLVGDSVDCISGVPGIGPVKGRLLLQEFETMDAIYQNLESIKLLQVRGASSLAKKLEDNRDLAYLSRCLATIVDDIDDEAESFSTVSLNALRRNNVDIATLTAFLKDMKFSQGFCSSMVSAAEKLNQASH